MTVAISRNHVDLRRQRLDPPQVMMAAVPRNHFYRTREQIRTRFPGWHPGSRLGGAQTHHRRQFSDHLDLHSP